MQIDVITLFPDLVRNALCESVIGRSLRKGICKLSVYQLRNWASQPSNSDLPISQVSKKKFTQVDDYPFGGGQGMLLKPEPFFRAVEELRTKGAIVIFMTPQGKLLKQNFLNSLITKNFQLNRSENKSEKQLQLIILCGHYEGIDHRVVEQLVDYEISIGDYILSNGALAAAVFIDALVRLLPGALNNPLSSKEESFSQSQFQNQSQPQNDSQGQQGNLLEAPQFTRPREFRNLRVPEVLLSGNHQEIQNWQKKNALLRTQKNRPDLLRKT